jgi:hypothetical protein
MVLSQNEVQTYLNFVGNSVLNIFPPTAFVSWDGEKLKLQTKGKINKDALIDLKNNIDKGETGIVFFYPRAFWHFYYGMLESKEKWGSASPEIYRPLQLPEEEYTLILTDSEFTTQLLYATTGKDAGDIFVAGIPTPLRGNHLFEEIERAGLLSEAKSTIYFVFENLDNKVIAEKLLPLYVYFLVKGKQVKIWEYNASLYAKKGIQTLSDYIIKTSLSAKDIIADATSLAPLFVRNLSALQIAEGITNIILSMPYEIPDALVDFLLSEFQTVGMNISDNVRSLLAERRQALMLQETISAVEEEKPQLLQLWKDAGIDVSDETLISFVKTPRYIFVQKTTGLYYMPTDKEVEPLQITPIIFHFEGKVYSNDMPTVKIVLYNTQTQKVDNITLSYLALEDIKTLQADIVRKLQELLSKHEAGLIATFLVSAFKQVKEHLPIKMRLTHYGWIRFPDTDKMAFVLPNTAEGIEGEDFKLSVMFSRKMSESLSRRHHDYIYSYLAGLPHRIPLIFGFATLLKGFIEEKENTGYQIFLNLKGQHAKRVAGLVQSIVAPAGTKHNKLLWDIPHVISKKPKHLYRAGYILIGLTTDTALTLHAQPLKETPTLWGYVGEAFAKYLLSADILPVKAYADVSPYYGTYFYEFYIYSETVRLVREYFNGFYNKEVLTEAWATETLRLIADIIALAEVDDLALKLLSLDWDLHSDVIEEEDDALLIPLNKKIPVIGKLREYAEELSEWREVGIITGIEKTKTPRVVIDKKQLISYVLNTLYPTLPYKFGNKYYLGETPVILPIEEQVEKVSTQALWLKTTLPAWLMK